MISLFYRHAGLVSFWFGEWTIHFLPPPSDFRRDNAWECTGWQGFSPVAWSRWDYEGCVCWGVWPIVLVCRCYEGSSP